MTIVWMELIAETFFNMHLMYTYRGSINKERLNTADSIDLEMCPAYSQTKITVSIDLEMCPAYSQTKNSKMGVNNTFDQNYRI